MEMQTAPSFGRTDSIVIPFPGQPQNTPADRPADNSPDAPRTAPGRTYTFKEAADLLDCGDESTLRNRYWKQKIEPAFRHCPTPLQSIAKYDTNGNPIYRLNGTAIEVLRAFLVAKAEGRDDAFLMAAREQFPAPPPPAQSEPEPQTQREINVETKAATVVETPALPQTYSLATLTTGSIEIDDPLALATQVVAAIDHVQSAMKTDIERKEQKLNDTRKAKEIVSNKVQELKFEQRLYQERNAAINSAQSQDTQSLQELASFLQALGKPPSDPPAG